MKHWRSGETILVPIESELESIITRLAGSSGVPAHLHGGLTRYIVHHVLPGGFLTAVLENNLTEAVVRADAESAAALGDIVKFLYHNAPSEAWGSPEKVAAWRTKDGQ